MSGSRPPPWVLDAETQRGDGQQPPQQQSTAVAAAAAAAAYQHAQYYAYLVLPGSGASIACRASASASSAAATGPAIVVAKGAKSALADASFAVPSATALIVFPASRPVSFARSPPRQRLEPPPPRQRTPPLAAVATHTHPAPPAPPAAPGPAGDAAAGQPRRKSRWDPDYKKEPAPATAVPAPASSAPVVPPAMPPATPALPLASVSALADILSKPGGLERLSAAIPVGAKPDTALLAAAAAALAHAPAPAPAAVAAAPPVASAAQRLPTPDDASVSPATSPAGLPPPPAAPLPPPQPAPPPPPAPAASAAASSLPQSGCRSLAIKYGMCPAAVADPSALLALLRAFGDVEEAPDPRPNSAVYHFATEEAAAAAMEAYNGRRVLGGYLIFESYAPGAAPAPPPAAPAPAAPAPPAHYASAAPAAPLQPAAMSASVLGLVDLQATALAAQQRAAAAAARPRAARAGGAAAHLGAPVNRLENSGVCMLVYWGRHASPGPFVPGAPAPVHYRAHFRAPSEAAAAGQVKVTFEPECEPPSVAAQDSWRPPPPGHPGPSATRPSGLPAAAWGPGGGSGAGAAGAAGARVVRTVEVVWDNADHSLSFIRQELGRGVTVSSVREVPYNAPEGAAASPAEGESKDGDAGDAEKEKEKGRGRPKEPRRALIVYATPTDARRALGAAKRIRTTSFIQASLAEEDDEAGSASPEASSASSRAPQRAAGPGSGAGPGRGAGREGEAGDLARRRAQMAQVVSGPERPDAADKFSFLPPGPPPCSAAHAPVRAAR
eukprot:tig00000470_g1169.t1